ncbi:MAG: hypothetical protein JWM10_779 [Myxococcaceae bacterium]|nr:hypothetical protein [Myxococcaceae bacterium]
MSIADGDAIEVEPLPHEYPDSAGAFAWNGRLIARGLFDGRCVVYRDGERAVAWRTEPLGRQSCGVAFAGDDLLCLTLDGGVGVDIDGVNDWGHRLVRVAAGAAVADRELRLPPGNWQLVRGPVRGLLVLYDTSQDQGLVGVDAASLTIAWRLPIETLHHLRWTPSGTLTALTRHEPRRCVELDARRGTVVRSVALPAGFRCTAAAALPDGRMVLGGRRLDEAGYVVATWAWRGEADPRWSAALNDCFSADRLALAEEDGQCCGYDLDEVADLVSSDDGATVLVALGGDGDTMTACHGACIAGVLALDDGSFRGRLIDDEDGCTGALSMSPGSWLVDCGGKLRVLRVRG